jgi:hypothetical protein
MGRTERQVTYGSVCSGIEAASKFECEALK